MKKPSKRIAAAAAAFAVSLNMNGCGVYGPAPYDEGDSYSASENIEATVYGPPDMMVETAETAETSETTETVGFDPAINEEACVYGPPEYFE